MSPRVVIAAQGVAVALLVLVVYVTLLREDSGTPLPEIKTPGSEQRAQGPGGGGGDRPGEDGKPGQGSASGGGPRGPTGGMGAILAGGPVTAVGGAGPVFRGPTPPADQYDDAVSGLLSKVRSAPGAFPPRDR